MAKGIVKIEKVEIVSSFIVTIGKRKITLTLGELLDLNNAIEEIRHDVDC